MGIPAGLRDHLTKHDRQETIIDHGFKLNAGWWDRTLGKVPGGPVRNIDSTGESDRITRGGVFTLADEAITDTTGVGALRLLWHSLHWGTNDSNRGNGKRISTVATDPDRFGRLLRDAAEASRRDPDEAFRLLRPHRRPTIAHLGPGFFTKFLYFAGGGDPAHPSLIVDSRVLRTLNALSVEQGEVRSFKYLFGYGPQTYKDALAALHQLAQDATEELGRDVAPDEVERWAFGR